MARTLPLVPGLRRTTPRFRWELFELAMRNGWSADVLASVMSLESGMRPSAVNPNGGATGLIQFMPATARGLGTTTAELKKMSAVEQLPYVERYFKRARIWEGAPTSAYALALWGANPRMPEHEALALRGQLAYAMNAPLDTDGDGRITGRELADRIDNNLFNRRRVAVPVERPATSAADRSAAGYGTFAVVAAVALGVGAAVARKMESRK